MIGMSPLTTDRLLVVTVTLAVVTLCWVVRRVRRTVRPRAPYRPVAGRRSHAVTVRGVRPVQPLGKRTLSPAQLDLVRQLFYQDERDEL